MNNNDIIKEFGFVNKPIDSSINIISEINNYKKNKNAIILGHYYITPELQEISDVLGDSLALAQAAKNTNSKIIVFLGVHFMAETAKIICPDKKVLIPDINAGCSLAESAPLDKFLNFKKNYPNHTVINYINCSADLKTVTDIIVTSSNAEKIVNSLPKNEKIIFGPDKNLGNYLNLVTGRNMILWDGACMVHEKYSLEKILSIKKENPDALFIAHPECEKPLLLIADHIGSTSSLLNFTKSSQSNKFIVATESGIIHQMMKSSPNKIFIPAPGDNSTCGCNDCYFMKLNTLEKLYLCLKYELPEISLSTSIIEKAKKPIERMLSLSKELGL